MSERLTDEELTRLMSDAEDMHSMYWIAAVSELRERRAQDLSADEVEALRGVRLGRISLPWVIQNADHPSSAQRATCGARQAHRRRGGAPMTTAERLHAARIALEKIRVASELLLRASNDLLIAVPLGNLHPSIATMHRNP